MKIVFSLCLLTLSTFSYAVDYQQEIDQFFELYKSGKVEQAVDLIYSSNQYVTAIPDQIAQVKNQLQSVGSLVGKLNKIAKLDTYSVADTFVHVTYLVTYDRQPLRFEFQFFKVNDGWRVYSFSFDDDFNGEIEVQARKLALSKQK